MDTPKLNPPTTGLCVAAASVTTMTGLGALAGWVDPHLAGPVTPHAALAGTVGNAGSILANNLRALSAPFVLALLGAGRTRVGRIFGDAIALFVLAANTIPVGIALGHWQGRLIPYIPQLPIEWTALAAALSAWLLVRNRENALRRPLPRLAVTTVVLVTVAAAVETWATPHRHLAQTANRPTTRLERLGASRGLAVVSAPDVAPPTASRFKVARSLPLTSVRFRSAYKGGADRAHNNHQPPQGDTP